MEQATRRDPLKRGPRTRARRPRVVVTGALAHSFGHGLDEYELDGRGYGKLLARQVAEQYQAAGLRVEGSSARGYQVYDAYGLRGTIEVRDVVGPFGPVAQA